MTAPARPTRATPAPGVAPGPLARWLGPRAPTRRTVGVACLTVAALAACAPDPGPLLPVAASEPDAPVIEAVTPAAGRAAGGDRIELRGRGFAEGQVAWLGHTVVYEVEVSADGTRLAFVAPATRAGARLDVGVGRTDDWGEAVLQRTVLPGAFSTSGPPRWVVGGAFALAGVFALLGAPLFVVIGAVTCLGWYLEAELKADVGVFTGADGRAGIGVDIFIAWLNSMGDSPLFIAIPLFTFAGTLMSESKAPTRIIDLCRALLGWLPGGLALVTLVTCCFFTAFTGASGVTIIALGGLLFPILLKEGYSERFSLGLLTTGGSLGLLFPPSLPVIVYGLVARVEVGRLFQAAVVPGVLLVALLFLTSFVEALRGRVPRHPFHLGDLGRTARAALWELPLPVLVVGGIYGGVVTAAEASAVTAAYVLLTTVVIYRDIPPGALVGVVRRTAVLVGAILVIMGTALGFSSWLTTEQIPQKILEAMQAHIEHPLAFLVMLNVFLLIVGCLMDIFSATLVVVPLIAPIAQEFGVDPYHLAVIFLVNLEIGYSTPPVGINLFIASLRFQRPVIELYVASLKFIGVLLVALLLITYVPALSLGFFDGLPAVRVLDEGVPRAADAPPDRVVLEVVEGQDGALAAEATLGGVDRTAAEAAVAAAEAALAAEEARLGLVLADLDRAVREAEAARDAASDPMAREVARQRLRAAVERRAPLEAVAAPLERARRQAQDLEQLHRTLRWRSRLDGGEATGPALPFGALRVGEHELTLTAKDGRGHIAQARVRVRVTPAPPPPPGDDGGWDDGR